MSKELDKQVAAMMAIVCRRRIPDRILEVVRHFDGEVTHEHSCHIEMSGKWRLTVEGGDLELIYLSCGSYHEGTHFKAFYGEFLVFEARLSNLDKFEQDDPRRVKKYKGDGLILVEQFIPGVWMDGLDLKRIIREQKRAEREAKRAAEKAAKAKPEEHRECDDVIRNRFGLKPF